MFGRKKDEEVNEAPTAAPAVEGDGAQAPKAGLKPAPQGARPAAYAAATVAKPEPRRAPEHPRTSHNGNGNGNGNGHSHGTTEAKRLIVGRDIVLNGAINSCDKLIVDGRVEATLNDCREMEITETGTYKGEASVDVALISGHFEGTWVARELLLVRAKGSVSGQVRFARLEVERGGEIEGDVSVIDGDERTTTTTRVSAGNGAAAHDEAAAH
jgi:cytoskeletal protein CcmA (bactofilin family)